MENEQNLPADPTGSIDDSFDVDAALSNIDNGPKSDIPMSQEETVETSQTDAQSVQELMFKHGDKEIKLPWNDPKVTQWAQQGYDYAQKMQAFNQERQQFEQKHAQINQIAQELETNPQLYETIKQGILSAKQGSSPQQVANSQVGIEKALEGLDPQHPLAQLLTGLQGKLSEHENYLNNWKQEKQLEAQKAEDAKIDAEIKSVREKYSDLDWNSADESGKTLENRVIEHAIKIGAKSFGTAFRDMMHEEIVKRAQESGKTAQLKEIEKNQKVGLLGKTPAPTKGISTPKNIKNQSYNDLLNEAMAEVRG
jgi:ribosomal protein L9